MDPDAIDRVVRKYAGELGLDRATQRSRCVPHSSPPHSRTAPQLGDVRKAGPASRPGTTKLYDRCGYNPEKGWHHFLRRYSAWTWLIETRKETHTPFDRRAGGTPFDFIGLSCVSAG